MRFGVFLPNFGPFGDPDALVELAVAAERYGWEGFFLWDHIVFDENSRPMADPWIALTAVATATEMLRIGTMLTPIARRRPWKLARETVTLDRISQGRVTLGVGLGVPAEFEFGTFGEETDDRERADKLDEGLQVLDGLWTGSYFQFEGEHMTVTGARFDAPVQNPRIPIWCGGWWPNRRPFRRAAKWDGVIPELIGGATPSPADVRDIRAYVAEHRTSEADFDLAINGYTEPGDPAVDDYEAAGATWWLERFDPDRFFSFDDAIKRIKAGTLHCRGEAGGTPIQKGTP
jgi:alkanesulfonate monooxygenase SsuD/methylene tetrahydromethanopterin reductase-like flavin-dependent oxidoreductase (luciferase family)